MIVKIDVFRRDKIIHTFVPKEGRQGGKWRILMNGSASRKSYSGVRWSGVLLTDAGTFSNVRPLRFDSPRSKIEGAGTGLLSWGTTNCGYAHGFEFTAPEGGGFELSVESSLFAGMYSDEELPGTMKIAEAPAEKAHLHGSSPLSGDKKSPVLIDLGHVDRHVILEPVVDGLPDEVSFTFTDPEPQAGVSPYWIRVTQRDMHIAWSSPVFFRYLD
jgi:hypothetical protein